ncbi:synaptonemal complex protein 2-like protein [Willisornis vidua]|uniref:Synaptonemal complex protein 2-like protein n=1 Tax=Willisornis vidua TaxID=1566151 RepID=A0ABQ9D9W4_9PASS|nr:synaptonemal complex protein 2-like protein [Willisornis vidua]
MFDFERGSALPAAWKAPGERQSRRITCSLDVDLESLLIDAFKGKGFEKISKLLQEGDVEPPQKYSESLFNQLDKALRKEMDKNEFQNVSLLLKCIQLYSKTDFQEGKSLFIEQGLVAKISIILYTVSWFERARGFVVLIDPDENKFLMLLLEDFFDCALALRTLNSILDSVPREERKKFPMSEEMCLLTKDLAKTILEVGDYDLQVALSEALCRLMIKKWRDDLVHHWFEDNYLAEAFKEIKDREFETVKKPSDEKLEEFWIDFNTGSQSVTFYVDSNEDALWESVRLSKEAVSSYSLQEDGRQKIVKIFMKTPAAFTKGEATKIKLFFKAEFEILSILKKVLGHEKFMINETEEKSVLVGKQAREKEAVKPESSNAQRRKDPSNSEDVERLSDNLTSEHSQQLTGNVAQKVVNPSAAVVTVSQQNDLEDANQGSAKVDKEFHSSLEDKALVSLLSSAKKSKTPSPRMKAKPSENSLEEVMEKVTPKLLELPPILKGKRNRKTSSAKQRSEERKEVFDFENSDSSSHEKVAEAKGKILGQKVSSQNQRTYETENKNKESNTLERRQPSYRKHLFSESNNENASTGQSEKSWILDSGKQLTAKSVDYTRKRSRVRSKLKDETLSEEAKESPPSPGVTARRYSSDVEEATQKFPDAPGNMTREEGSIKRKDSDVLEGTVIKKPKFSSWEANDLSSDMNYKPRKIFDSVEEKVEIQKGQEMDYSVDDVFFPKTLHEDFSHSGVITAFEAFIGQLKKLFWSRHKGMEISTQNALRSSEKNLTTLLNQIHECRLSKLETFQKIVVEELASLEKETQFLANMEKEAVDFWNAHLLKLDSFCNQQKQRIESVDSGLGFGDTIQNTKDERSVKKTEENNVFIVPSD